jgi:hypothetical protein
VTPAGLLYCRPVLKPVVIILSAGLVLAGCSDAADQGGLLGALGRVAATAETRAYVEYGEPAAVAALPDKDRYLPLRGFGYSSIAMHSVTVEDALAIDLDGFDGAILLGEPPKQATVLWGEYDKAAVDGKLRDLGIDSELGFRGMRWRSAPDYEINFADGPFTGVVPLNQFNNIVTGGTSFAFAPAEEGIKWVTEPGDETLADDDVLAPLATCLGDVIAATLLATGEAVGVRRDASEVICLDGDQATVTDALKGTVPSSGEPWDQVLPGAEVGEDGSLVRITVPAQDDKPVGRVLRMMVNGDLAEFR